MALSEFARKRIERIVGAFIETRRPPPRVRPQLDLGFRFAGQSVELFELRPQYDRSPDQTPKTLDSDITKTRQRLAPHIGRQP